MSHFLTRNIMMSINFYKLGCARNAYLYVRVRLSALAFAIILKNHERARAHTVSSFCVYFVKNDIYSNAELLIVVLF